MPDREHILNKVRAALGRRSGQAPEPMPAPRLVPAERTQPEKVRLLLENFPGDNLHAHSAEDAQRFVALRLDGQAAIASNNPILQSLGITDLPNVHSNVSEKEEIRRLCAEVDVGVSGAAYALADPGALVMVSSAEEEQLVSLLPPRHIAVVSAERVLSDLGRAVSYRAGSRRADEFDGVDRRPEPHGRHRDDSDPRGARPPRSLASGRWLTCPPSRC